MLTRVMSKALQMAKALPNSAGRLVNPEAARPSIAPPGLAPISPLRAQFSSSWTPKHIDKCLAVLKQEFTRDNGLTDLEAVKRHLDRHELTPQNVHAFNAKHGSLMVVTDVRAGHAVVLSNVRKNEGGELVATVRAPESESFREPVNVPLQEYLKKLPADAGAAYLRRR